MPERVRGPVGAFDSGRRGGAHEPTGHACARIVWLLLLRGAEGAEAASEGAEAVAEERGQHA